MAQLGKDIHVYDYCWSLSESRWAWEFLRRNASFRKIASEHNANDISTRKACHGITIVRPKFDQTEAQRWGLVCMPDPDENGFDGNVFWSSALYPRSISIHVSQRGDDEVDDIFTESMRNCAVVHLTDLAGREHLLIKGNGRVVQVECTGLSLLSLEPVWTCPGLIPALIDDYLLSRRQDYGSETRRRLPA